VKWSAAVVLVSLSALGGGVAWAQTTPECPEATRAFEHALGFACVPEQVERVVALEWTYAEDLLALGVQPVGVADIAGYSDWVRVPVSLDETVVDVGTRQEPNLERIAELEPDLIVTASFRATNNYDELNAIAPVLAFDPYPTDGSSHYQEMLSTFATIADVVGREAEAEAVIDALEAHFAAAERGLEAAGRAGESFILSQGWVANDAATFRLFTDNAMAVQILEQIGLENAWDDAPQLYGFTEISFEGFAGIGDTNFFYVAQNDANLAFAESPLWSGLPFVQSDRAYWLGGDVWLFGGPLSAQLLVDTILSAMGVPVPQAETTPEAAETGA
jgi:iron complex transport system substrate-binding protein